jgi:hypothetical protein
MICDHTKYGDDFTSLACEYQEKRRRPAKSPLGESRPQQAGDTSRWLKSTPRLALSKQFRYTERTPSNIGRSKNSIETLVLKVD